MIGAPVAGPIARLYDAVPFGGVPLEAVTVIAYEPCVVGVPLSTPFEGFMLSPGGCPLRLQLIVGVPLLVENVCGAYGEPTCPIRGIFKVAITGATAGAVLQLVVSIAM